MKVAIITVNYNGKEDTLDFLESLKKLTLDNVQLKTVVVDNASSDGSVRVIHQQFPKVDIIQTGANLGFSGGYNKGLEYAALWGADYFLLINNDCLLSDGDLLSQLIRTAQSDEKIGLVSPKIYFAPGFEFHKDRYSPSEVGKVIWYAGGRFDWDNIGSVHRGLDEVDQGLYTEVVETDIFSGACVLIKKVVLEKVGLFDEQYFLYFEDSDLGKRATDWGFKIYYNGKVSIYHKVSKSTGIGSEITDYYHTRNKLIFGMNYGRLRTKLALLKEAVWLLLVGRAAQRQGVWDFFIGEVRDVEEVRDVGYPLKLSIGIVNYNTADLTKKLVESIFRNGPSNMEVIVLDNGNVDPCKDKIKEYLLASRRSGPKIKYLKNEENEGFSKGYNKTIKYSLGEYYLMLNSDIEVSENSLSEMIKWADHYQGQAVLGGRLYFPNGDDQDSAFHLPTITGAFKEYFLAQKGSYFMYLPKGDKPVQVEGLVMACLLLPKKVLEKVGLLDEGSFIFFEDIEYARRLGQFGIPLYFIPTAKFIHHHGASTQRLGTDKAFKLLQKASQHYHGKIYYNLLTLVLKLGQKLGRVQTPVSRWTKKI